MNTPVETLADCIDYFKPRTAVSRIIKNIFAPITP